MIRCPDRKRGSGLYGRQLIEKIMEYSELLGEARVAMGGKLCRACEVCNGRACRNMIPGPGAKGVGDNAVRNYDAWRHWRVNMDTICELKPVDMSLELLGHRFKYPFFAAPVGAVNIHCGERYNDCQYNNIMVSACADAGIAAFTGDGVVPEVMSWACDAIHRNGGVGIPTIKPWDIATIRKKAAVVASSGAFAVAMDVDAAGLPFLRNSNPPAGSKSVAELREIITEIGKPFIVKGVMTMRGAEKAIEAGASAIVVSNHGGRVLDQCAATAEVLEPIAKAVKGRCQVLVDGGIRSGVDIFKAIALGADGVLICRPFVVAAFGGAEAGVKYYIERLAAELEDTMRMCGAHSLADITREMLTYSPL